MNRKNSKRHDKMRLFRRPGGGNCLRVMREDEGGSIVEMALACSVLFLMLIGIFQMSFVLYTYNYISDAAREGARWAIVRGNSCILNTPSLDHCGTAGSPGASGTDIQTHVENLPYPGINSYAHMTVTTTWLTGTILNGTTTWSACGTTSACKAPGNQVQVNVTYNFPLSIPWYKTKTLKLQSTSAMVISQ